MRRLYPVALVVFVSFLFGGLAAGQTLNQIQFITDSGVELFGSSTATFDVSTKATTGGAIHIYSRSTGTGIYVASSTNNVGIGTTDPGGYKLNLAGNLNVDGRAFFTVGEDPQVFTIFSGPNGSNLFDINGETGNITLADLGYGKVGVGTANPSSTLHVVSGGGTSATFDGQITIGYPSVSTDAARKDYVDNNFAQIGGTSGIWRLSGSNLYASSTSWNVGIGTASPATKLDVNGTETTNRISQWASGSTYTELATRSWGGNNAIFFGAYATSTYANGDFLTAGNTLHKYASSSFGAADHRAKAIIGDHSGVGFYISNVSPGANQNVTWNQEFLVTPSNIYIPTNNVGIGEVSPGSKLSVSGNATIGASYDTTAAPANGLIIQGSVGIGVTSPTSTLFVNGDITANGGDVIFADVGTSNMEYISSFDGGLTGINTSGVFGFYADSAMGAAVGSPTAGISVKGIYSSDKVGIGTTTPSGLFSVSTGGAWNLGDTYPFQFINLDGAGNEGDGLLVRAGSLSVNSNIFTVQDYNGVNKFNVTGDGIATFASPLTVAYPVATTDAATKSYVDAVAGIAQSASWVQSGSNLYTSSTSWNVGVGTTTPISKLEVSDNTTSGTLYAFPTLRINNRSTATASLSELLVEANNGGVQGRMFVDGLGTSSFGAGVSFGTRSNHKLNLLTNNTIQATIDTSGNLGVGTTTPVGSAHFWSSAGDEIVYIEADADNNAEDDNPALILRQDGNLVNGLFGIMGAATQYTGALANSTFIESKDSGGAAALQFVTGGTTIGGTNGVAQMTILANGRVGVSTTAPVSTFHVAGNVGVTGAIGTASSRPAVGTSLINGEIHGYDSNASLASDGGLLRLSAGGGTGAYRSFIDLTGYNNTGTDESVIVLGTRSAERMRINNAGNVGIGTSTPNVELTVYSASGNAGSFNQPITVGYPSVSTDAATKSYVDTVAGIAQSAYWVQSGSNIYPSSSSWNLAVGTNTNDGGAKLLVKQGDGHQIAIGGASFDGIKSLNITYSNTYDGGSIQAYEELAGVKKLLLNSLGGNVGIGTTNPTSTLTVVGSATINDSVVGSNSGVLNVTNTNTAGTAGTSTALVVSGSDFGSYSGSTYNNIGIRVNGGDTFGALHRSYALYAEVGSGSGSEYAAYFGGSVGINTLTPAGALDVASAGTAEGYWLDGKAALTGESSDNWLRLNQSSSWSNGVYTPSIFRADGEIRQGSADAGAYGIQTSGSFYAATNSITGGSVGVGTSTPATKIHLFDGSSGPIVTMSGLTNVYRGITVKNTTGAEQWFYGPNTSNNFVIRRSGTTDELTVSSSGGISSGSVFTLSSATPFNLTNIGSGTYNKTVIYNDLANGFYLDLARATDSSGGTPIDFTVAARGGNYFPFFIEGSNGRVGVNTVSPSSTLHVVGTITATKLNADEVDPPYTINGKKYATYMAGMTGLKEETSGVVKLKNGKAVLDLVGANEGSDLWLFAQTINLSGKIYVSESGQLHETDSEEVLNNVIVLLTPSFDGRVWYEKKNGKIFINSSEKIGEISYRLTAPRFDAVKKDGNLRTGDDVEGLNLDKLLK